MLLEGPVAAVVYRGLEGAVVDLVRLVHWVHWVPWAAVMHLERLERLVHLQAVRAGPSRRALWHVEEKLG